jgi:hypothetical protein
MASPPATLRFFATSAFLVSLPILVLSAVLHVILESRSLIAVITGRDGEKADGVKRKGLNIENNNG